MSDNPFVTVVTQQSFPTEVTQRSAAVPVLVDFWATWCKPCLETMPQLQKLYSAYSAKGFEILGVWNSHSTLNHSDFMPSHFVSESYYDSLLMLLTSLRRIQLLNKCLNPQRLVYSASLQGDFLSGTPSEAKK